MYCGASCAHISFKCDANCEISLGMSFWGEWNDCRKGTSLAWWMRFDSYCETVTKMLATDGEWHLLCVSLTRIWTDIWSFNRINPSALFLTFSWVDCLGILWAKIARSTLLEPQQISLPMPIWWKTANDANENETRLDVYHNICWQNDLFLFTFRANSKLRNKKNLNLFVVLQKG